jgi:hypothetical protein
VALPTIGQTFCVFERHALTGLEAPQDPTLRQRLKATFTGETTLRQRLKALFTRKPSFRVPYEVKFGSMVAMGVIGVVGVSTWHSLGVHSRDHIGALFAFALLGDAISDYLWQRLGRRGLLPAWILVPRRKGNPRPSLFEEWAAHRRAVRSAADSPRLPSPHNYPGLDSVSYSARDTWSRPAPGSSRDR